MVAVKMLKEDATEDVLKDFEREACMLSEFDHPHIVRLLGVCAIGRPMCLLFEYMSRGDLSVYLRACSPNSYLTEHHAEKSSIAANTTASSGGGISCNGFGGDVKIGHIEQVQIAKQVCSGMVYLSDRKFVHRDLASRNCLLDASGSCKIADFGLSQRVFSHHGECVSSLISML
jgi:receptor tyrosine kinase